MKKYPLWVTLVAALLVAIAFAFGIMFVYFAINWALLTLKLAMGTVLFIIFLITFAYALIVALRADRKEENSQDD